MMASMNFFELLGLSSDQFADAMPERIVEVGGQQAAGRGASCARAAARLPAVSGERRWRRCPRAAPPGWLAARAPWLAACANQHPRRLHAPLPQAFHTGGKEAVRELVYQEVSERLRVPLHVRSADSTGQVRAPALVSAFQVAGPG